MSTQQVAKRDATAQRPPALTEELKHPSLLKMDYNGGVEAHVVSELRIVGMGEMLIRHAAGALPAVATKTAVGLSAHFSTTVGAAAPFFTTTSFTALLTA